jgi:hypothetical protein
MARGVEEARGTMVFSLPVAKVKLLASALAHGFSV